MKTFITEFRAICIEDGEIHSYEGRQIKTLTFGMAEQICRERFPYLKVLGELVAEIPCKTNEDGYPYEPDFDNRIDYDLAQLN